MAAMSLAILGKNDEPLYLREFYATDDDERIAEEELFGLPSHPDGTATDDNKKKGSTVFDCSLRQQFILHAALDRFEQLSGPPPGFAWRKPGVVGTDAMFVGLLCPVEHLRVYGYMTTTHIRFLLTVEDPLQDHRNPDDDIKRLFEKLHRLYVEYTMNPFSTLNAPIQSAQFDSKVEACVEAFNEVA